MPVGLVVLAATAAHGHPLAPSLLSLEAHGEGRYAVTWRTPTRVPVASRPEPVLPERCRPLSAPRAERSGSALSWRWEVDCGAGGLSGARIGVGGLVARGAGALVRVELEGGVLQALLSHAEPSVRIPAAPSPLAVARDYLGLGAEHLVSGLDHVLFVLGLLLLVQGRRALLLTVTGFTLGHSATLSWVALGLGRVPAAWVEVAIAGTLVALAAEVVPARAPRRALFGRRPWRMAALFGLLHGLGFAGALAEVGLPHAEVPLALVSFNLGIEAGQLAIVAAALLARRLVAPLGAGLAGPARWAMAYGMGLLAAFWAFERASVALAG